MKFISITIFIIYLFSPDLSNAQYFPEDNEESLQGITEFDARIVVRAWFQVEADQDWFTQTLKETLN